MTLTLLIAAGLALVLVWPWATLSNADPEMVLRAASKSPGDMALVVAVMTLPPLLVLLGAPLLLETALGAPFPVPGVLRAALVCGVVLVSTAGVLLVIRAAVARSILRDAREAGDNR